jgi:hypothetical protein
MTGDPRGTRLQPGIFTLVITGHAGHYPLAEIVVTGTATSSSSRFP